jgi:hypothetical protein
MADFYMRRFLSSELFSLKATASDTPYNIHIDLLSSKSPVLWKACKNGMKETEERQMRCEGYSESVLVSFVQWAYTGGYSDDRGALVVQERPGDEEEVAPPTDDANAKEQWPIVEDEESSIQDESIHPLLLHIQVCVFANEFIIEPLQDLAIGKVKDRLKELGSLEEAHERNVVLDLLEYAFDNLLETDPFLDWLGNYISWKLEELRQSPDRFETLVAGSKGSFANHLIRHTTKSSVSPWNSEESQIASRYPEKSSKKSKRTTNMWT